MKPQRKEELRQKGWREEDLAKAEAILDKTTKHDIFFSKIVFWSALLVIIFANLLVSIILIPFLITLYDLVLYAIVALLGLVIGFLYNFLITDIGLLETKHHRAASIIIPIIAVGNIIVMVLTANKFIENIHLNNQPHNPWIVAAVFGGAFILPYIVDQIRMAFQR
ncbi:MAG: hypothetical protein Q7S55_01500 [Nanoarchaeota archaeon]|nr:hypothetical protein [Nanoarchaeota archaeon]